MDIGKIKVGSDFKLRRGPSSLKRRLSRATRHGAKHLHPHVDDIVNVVAGYETRIRTKGGLTRIQRRTAKREIVKKIREKTGIKTTLRTREDIKKILEKLSAKGATKNNGKTILKTSGSNAKNSNLSEAQKKRNIRSRRRMEEEQTRGGFIGQRPDVKDDVKATQERLGIRGGREMGAGTHFAGDVNKNMGSSVSVPKKTPSSPSGIKPLGFN